MALWRHAQRSNMRQLAHQSMAYSRVAYKRHMAGGSHQYGAASWRNGWLVARQRGASRMWRNIGANGGIRGAKRSIA